MDKLGHPKKRAWLAAYGKCGVVRQSCAAADLSHGAYYGWLKDDPQFAEAVRYAKEEFIERLEMEADRRAVEGVPRLKFHNGRPVIDPTTGQPYIEREYSDLLLIFRLKALRPDADIRAVAINPDWLDQGSQSICLVKAVQANGNC
jgi:hypothetical protein